MLSGRTGRNEDDLEMGLHSRLFRSLIYSVLYCTGLGIVVCSPMGSAAHAADETCRSVAHSLNKQLSSKINEPELVEILKSLNNTGNRRLPPKFVTTKQAIAKGWKPGKNLWSVLALKKKSLGGDVFNNHEGKLPQKQWREADLAYQGGRRGGKRIVFSEDGMRMITVDHYASYMEVPACR